MSKQTIALVLAATLAASLGACAPVMPGTSATLLDHEQAQTFVAGSPAAAAKTVADLFAKRGFTVIDQHADGAGIDLVLAGTRMLVIGSEFAVNVQPARGGVSTAEMFGVPTLAGLPTCGVTLGSEPCRPADTDDPTWAMTGSDEAQIIQGVTAELAVAQQAAPQPPALAQLEQQKAAGDAAAVQQCLATRHDIFARASTMTDPNARGALLQTAPECATP